MKKKFLIIVFSIFFFTLTGGFVFGNGMLVPSDLPPLSLQTQYITVNINNQVATVRVEETFYNSTDKDLEGIYYFPLPENGSVAYFARWNGEEWIEAKVKKKNDAECIYKSGDPHTTSLGLAEYSGENSFKTSVKPIPAGKEITIAFVYNEVLSYEEGLCHFTYPLNSAGYLKDNLKDLSLKVLISSQMNITDVFSNTHRGISVRKKDENNYEVFYEKRNVLPDRDFTLSYEVSPGDVGINMLTYSNGEEAGYFMLLLTPVIETLQTDIANRDVLFVIDRSGSMDQANKMEQAREAFKYCLGLLNEKDYFNIIVFDDRVNSYREEMVPVSKENIKDASLFIDSTDPDGGTNIYDALIKGLSLFKDNSRPKVIVLLTDGMHNTGQFSFPQIVNNNISNARIFTLGVGYSVDNILLEKVSHMNRGDFIEIENTSLLEEKLSDFYKKISKPVLTDLSLDFEGLEPLMTYPEISLMPDLFIGSQVVLMGKYEQSGKGKAMLKGFLNGEEKIFTSHISFPEKTDEANGFLPRLWASRRIDFLLSEIRQKGEKGNWKDEIVSLGEDYNLVTPYTSLLLVDQGVAKIEDKNSHPSADNVILGSPQSNVVSYHMDSESYGIDEKSYEINIGGRTVTEDAPDVLFPKVDINLGNTSHGFTCAGEERCGAFCPPVPINSCSGNSPFSLKNLFRSPLQLFIFILLLMVAGGLFFYRKYFKNKSQDL